MAMGSAGALSVRSDVPMSDVCSESGDDDPAHFRMLRTLPPMSPRSVYAAGGDILHDCIQQER